MTVNEGDSRTVRLLGAVTAWHGCTELALGPAQRRAVFAVLAVRAGQVVSREELIEAVWGENPPPSATGSVYTYISALRRALGSADILSTTRAGYCLNLPKPQIDVHLAERHLDEARAHRLACDDQAESNALSAALALWQGEALTGIPGPYAETQRARLEEMRMYALERHAEVTLRLGGHRELAGELAPLVRQHPLHEGLHRMHITALYRSGRQAEAAEAFSNARETIIEQSGLEPGAGLLALSQRMRTVAPGPPRPPVFVGRQGELDRVRQADQGALWIEGDAGSGKSALLAEALASRANVRWAAGDELCRRTPLSLIADCLGETQHPERTVTDLCAQGPLVLVFEDLQWADEESLFVWQRLHRLTGHLPLLLIGSARPRPHRRELAMLRENAEVIILSGLDETATADLADEVLGRCPADATLAFMRTHSGGNPAYLSHLLDEYAQGHDITAPGAMDGRPKPAALVEDHLASLSLSAKRMLNSAALFGDTFGVADLTHATGIELALLIESVEEALDAGVLEAAGELLRFRVPLVRAVFYAATPPAMRAMLHQQIAATMATSGAHPERVAEQLFAAPESLTRDWVPEWVLANLDELSADRAVELLHRISQQWGLPEELRLALTAALARLLLPEAPCTPHRGAQNPAQATPSVVARPRRGRRVKVRTYPFGQTGCPPGPEAPQPPPHRFLTSGAAN
ncbi:DNA-binding transcriptional activator of the SARP family [Amycolatopsis xylanica]|uniref:DNA-binding transcriptional activator of the SARP family n=1 Tax=Amycolatopsis xylanica TaxID=589385 RepID=A0A1H3GXX3_9PSEU|nr:BTAD domain-containing putative transcriptional regulator [Amycolatopsis xylanica]SDY07815.1 DNA-binding transcriptional activator of the SARP family [Amycolatopsis xylanica]